MYPDGLDSGEQILGINPQKIYFTNLFAYPYSAVLFFLMLASGSPVAYLNNKIMQEGQALKKKIVEQFPYFPI